MTDLEKVILEHLGKRLHNCEVSNEGKVKMIDLIGGYLNLETIADYSKRTGMSYNGVKARIESGKIKEYELFNVKFVIDNE